MKRLARVALEADHFETDDRVAAAFPVSAWSFHDSTGFSLKSLYVCKRLSKVVWSSKGKWSVDRTAAGGNNPGMKKPVTDYKETKGLVYFARMLDKIRLKARGELPPDYFVGVDDDPTVFDARCTRFLGVDYSEMAIRTLQGGADEEILEWCFQKGRKPSGEEIQVWNAFLLKRGWRDEASEELQAAKERNGWADRDDIQTWVDLHDAEEGRAPRR